MFLKMQTKLCNIIVVFIIQTVSFLAVVHAVPQRIAQIDFDLTKVFKLYTSPGRDTTIYFPCAVEYATSGTAEDIKLSLPKKFPNIVTVFLRHSKSESTSLKVLCSDRAFVFDLVPSTHNHIDFLKIINSHGELPRYSDRELLKKPPIAPKPTASSKAAVTGKIIYSTKKRSQLDGKSQ